MEKDLYKVLNVDKNASQTEIKKEYYKLAKQFHPDLNPGDDECANKFKEISKAYEILGNKESRYKYDHGITDNSYGMSMETARKMYEEIVKILKQPLLDENIVGKMYEIGDYNNGLF